MSTFPVTVSTRTITFLVGDPYINILNLLFGSFVIIILKECHWQPGRGGILNSSLGRSDWSSFSSNFSSASSGSSWFFRWSLDHGRWNSRMAGKHGKHCKLVPQIVTSSPQSCFEHWYLSPTASLETWVVQSNSAGILHFFLRGSREIPISIPASKMFNWSTRKGIILTLRSWEISQPRHVVQLNWRFSHNFLAIFCLENWKGFQPLETSTNAAHWGDSYKNCLRRMGSLGDTDGDTDGDRI